MLQCPDCGGDGGFEASCQTCLSRGQVELVGCPYAAITPDVEQAFVAAAQARLGNWPVGGGWLEQTKTCLEAVQLIESLEPERKS